MAAASSPQEQFFTHRLSNGLQVLAQRMPDMESVAVAFYVRTGSRDEHDPALDGISHFLEHMVFKGTAHRGTEEITLAFNNMGAEFNAFTDANIAGHPAVRRYEASFVKKRVKFTTTIPL